MRPIGWVSWDETKQQPVGTAGGSSTRSCPPKVWDSEAKAKRYCQAQRKGARQVFVAETTDEMWSD